MNKHFRVAQIKAASGATDGTFVLNEESEDRVGDVIEVAGWQLDNFQKNAPALWNHDSSKLVGQWENVKVVGKQLIGDLRLASTSLGKMAKTLIDEGILKAVSVGFLPLEYEPLDKDSDGYLIKSAELLEVSLVSVPAHPNALLLSKHLGLTAADRRAVFSVPLAKRGAPNPIAQTILSDLKDVRRLKR